jgi:hypothetical protein
MKRLAAISLSLLLLWVQAVVLAGPLSSAKASCGCCDCKATCCVAGDSSVPPSQAPAGVPTAQNILNSYIPIVSLAWLMPRGEAEVSLPDSLLPFHAACVPLFERDCALLI